MDIMEKTDFYKKFLELKDAKNLKWSSFGTVLGKSDAAMRMAFNKESLKDYEMELLEENFCPKEKPSTSTMSVPDFITENFDEIVSNPAIENEIEARALRRAFYWMQNPEEFKEYLKPKKN